MSNKNIGGLNPEVDSNESGSAVKNMVSTVIRLPSEESTDFQLVTSIEMAKQAGLAKPLKAHQVMRFLIRKNRDIKLDHADIAMLKSIVQEDESNRKTRTIKA